MEGAVSAFFHLYAVILTTDDEEERKSLFHLHRNR